MTMHLMRLVWNRKRQNLLLTVEIFLSFLVLFVVVLFTVTYAVNWRQPLGFDVSRVWGIWIRYPESGPMPQDGMSSEMMAARAEAVERFHRVYSLLEELPNVELAAGSYPSVPYGRGGWNTGIGDPFITQSAANFATDEFADVVGAEIIAGRWFTPEDDGLRWAPAVINQRLAGELFGDDDPLGKVLPVFRSGTNNAQEVRVVGVITDFRQEGEPAPPGNYTFLRMRKNDPAGAVLPNGLAIRVTADTTADFEPILLKALEQVAPEWAFEVRPLEVEREQMLRSWIIPLVVFSIVAAFLLVMVALGLTGVVWQNVTRRTREFGLRRAQGARVEQIRRQVLAEIALLTSLGLAVGVALVAQLPLLPLQQMEIAAPTPAGWAGAIAASVTIIYLLTLTCAWYPSRLATAIQPAEALHYE